MKDSVELYKKCGFNISIENEYISIHLYCYIFHSYLIVALYEHGVLKCNVDISASPNERTTTIIFKDDGRDYNKILTDFFNNYVPKYIEYVQMEGGEVIPSNYAKRMYKIKRLLEYDNKR